MRVRVRGRVEGVLLEAEGEGGGDAEGDQVEEQPDGVQLPSELAPLLTVQVTQEAVHKGVLGLGLGSGSGLGLGLGLGLGCGVRLG